MPAVRRSSQNANFFTGLEIQKHNPRPATGGFLNIKAYAKINLFLDITGKRPDGYHDIVSVMQTVDLHDDLTFCRTVNSRGFSLVSGDKDIPDNIVTRAAKHMIQKYRIDESFEIRLTKRIPIGAGLAGGSADCAAAIIGINEFFGINADVEELIGIAQSLGADVPFCLYGGIRLAEGIGEKLTELPPHPDCFIVLAYPDIAVSTKAVFEKFIVKNPNSTGLKKILAALYNNDLTEVALSLYNVFEDLTSQEFPIIKRLIQELKTCGAIGASMTGTGSAVYGYFAEESAAIKASNALSNLAKTYMVRPICGRELIS